jgi:hypothetical protein
MWAGEGHGGRVLGYNNQARSLLHMGDHVRQTQQPGALSFPAKNRPKKPVKAGFGVEYALYMMDLSKVYNIGNTGKSALSRGVFQRSKP